MALVVTALMLNWFMISYAHLKFRAAKDKEKTVTKFPTFWYPMSNYLCLVFFVAIVFAMLFIDGIKTSVYLMPAWLIFLGITYKALRK